MIHIALKDIKTKQTAVKQAGKKASRRINKSIKRKDK